MPDRLWMSRDPASMANDLKPAYDLWSGEVPPTLSRRYSGVNYDSMGDVAWLFEFCPVDFEAATSFRLEPGECVEVNVFVVRKLDREGGAS